MPSTTKTTLIEAFAAKSAKQNLEPFEYEPAQLKPYDIEVDITHCGICHSDLHLINNEWMISKYPLVPGHEIIGIIKAKGEMVGQFKIGQRVGIGWQRSSCLDCHWCKIGEEELCKKAEATCVGNFGGFAEKIRTDSRFAFTIPDNLASENAAPLLCGGATVFSPFIENKINGTQRVGVIGIGGLGHLAIQFANALGCEVIAFSSSASKKEEAKEFGAHSFVLTSDKKQMEAAKESIDFLLSTVSSSVNWLELINLLRPLGKLCLLGAPENGKIEFPIPSLLNLKKTICSSIIGGRHSIDDMLSFASKHKIVAKIELFPMKEANKAIERLSKNQVRYRAVLHNS